MMKLLPVILILLFFGSCKQVEKRPLVPVSGYLPFASDPELSDKYGKPVDSLTGYIPAQKLFDTVSMFWYYMSDPGSKWVDPKSITTRKSLDSISDVLRINYNGGKPQRKQYFIDAGVPLDSIHEFTEVVIDSFNLLMCAEYLSQMKEPVLHNYHLGETIYRLTHVPGIMWGPFSVSFIRSKAGDFMTIKTNDDKKEDSLVINERIEIRKTLFDSVAALIESKDFVSLSSLPTAENDVTDEPGNFLEVHNSQGYLYVFRWGYDDALFKRIAMMFFDASDILHRQQMHLQKKYKLDQH